MSYKLSTGSKFGGQPLYAAGVGVRIRRLVANGTGPDMTDAGILATGSAPDTLGRGTGRLLTPTVVRDSKGVIQEGWVELVHASGITGWVRHDLLTLITPTARLTENDAKKLVEGLVNRDRVLGQRLAYCGELLRRIKAKPGQLSTAQLLQFQTTFDGLNNRLKSRQQALQSSTAVKVTGFENPTELVFGKSVQGIGVIPVAVWAVVAGVVVVAALVAWQYFKPHGEASEIDLSKCRTFEALLATAAPEIQQQVLKEVNGEVKAAYEKGASDSSGPLGGFADALKWGVFGYVALQLLGGRQQGGG